MKDIRILPTPRTLQFGQDTLALERNLSLKAVDELDKPFADFPDNVESVFRRAGIKVRFFVVEDFAPHAYKLEVAQGGIIVCGGDTHGLFYGYQTLLQILRQCTESIPCCIIEDSPDMLFRAFHIDLSIHKYKVSYLKLLFNELARLKYTAVVINYNDTFPYKKEPLITGPINFSDGKLEEIRKAAELYGLELIPGLHVAGTVTSILGLERYTTLSHESNLPLSGITLEHPRMVKIITTLIDELSNAHTSRRMMINTAPCIGSTMNASAATQEQGETQNYFFKLFEHIDKKKIVPLICSNILETYPECRDALPDGAMIVVRDEPRDTALSTALKNAKELGVGALAAVPGRTTPDNELARDNVRAANTARDAASSVKRAGALGAVICSPPSSDGDNIRFRNGMPLDMMHGSRRMHISTTWYAIAAAADAFWNEKDADEKNFEQTWPLYWFGIDDKRADDIYRLQARDVFQGAGHPEIVRDRKRILRTIKSLEPALRAADLEMIDFYARMSLHAVHVRQIFNHTPKKQEMSLLRSEISRLRERHKNVMKSSIYNNEIKDEQDYLFGHTEELLERMKRRS